MDIDGRCQRWRDGAHSWRRAADGGLDRSRYDVEVVAEADAKAFVVTHHYSRTYPAARLRYGLYDHGELVGVAVLGIPVQARVLTSAFPALVPYTESLELSRFVLLDEVPANGETMFLARVLKLAGRTGIRGVVSFSDPMPRPRTDGTVAMPGHIGTIYAASNATYAGRGSARRALYVPSAGVVLNERSLSKVRAGDRGHRYMERKLVELGARGRLAGEDLRDWLDAALRDVGAVSIRHRGPHRYLFRTGNRAERRHVQLGLTSQAYPKVLDPAPVLHSRAAA